VTDEVVVVGSLGSTPIFTTSLLLEELAFLYVAPSLITLARDLKVHPFAMIAGKPAMNPCTSASVISCSNVIRPGLFGAFVTIRVKEAVIWPACPLDQS
jgi:hypothetical protein